MVEAKDRLGSGSISVSHDCIGMSGELCRISKMSPLANCRLEIFLFFEDDVLAASCERSSRNFGVCVGV